MSRDTSRSLTITARDAGLFEALRHGPQNGEYPIHKLASLGDVEKWTNALKAQSVKSEETRRKHGGWITFRNNDGNTVFHILAEKGHVKCLKVVLAANPNLQALFELAGVKNEELSTLLNERNGAGLTPLHVALKNGKDEMAMMLIKDQRVDVNVRNPDGLSPLHVALKIGQDEVAMMLIKDQRVDVNVRNPEGLTPLQVALGLRKAALADLLIGDDRVVKKGLDEFGGFFLNDPSTLFEVLGIDWETPIPGLQIKAAFVRQDRKEAVFQSTDSGACMYGIAHWREVDSQWLVQARGAVWTKDRVWGSEGSALSYAEARSGRNVDSWSSGKARRVGLVGDDVYGWSTYGDRSRLSSGIQHQQQPVNYICYPETVTPVQGSKFLVLQDDLHLVDGSTLVHTYTSPFGTDKRFGAVIGIDGVFYGINFGLKRLVLLNMERASSTMMSPYRHDPLVLALGGLHPFHQPPHLARTSWTPESKPMKSQIKAILAKEPEAIALQDSQGGTSLTWGILLAVHHQDPAMAASLWRDELAELVFTHPFMSAVYKRLLSVRWTESLEEGNCLMKVLAFLIHKSLTSDSVQTELSTVTTVSKSGDEPWLKTDGHLIKEQDLSSDEDPSIVVTGSVLRALVEAVVFRAPVALVKLVLACGAPVSLPEDDSKSLLHIAALREDDDALAVYNLVLMQTSKDVILMCKVRLRGRLGTLQEVPSTKSALAEQCFNTTIAAINGNFHPTDTPPLKELQRDVAKVAKSLSEEAAKEQGSKSGSSGKKSKRKGKSRRKSSTSGSPSSAPPPPSPAKSESVTPLRPDLDEIATAMIAQPPPTPAEPSTSSSSTRRRSSSRSKSRSPPVTAPPGSVPAPPPDAETIVSLPSQYLIARDKEELESLLKAFKDSHNHELQALKKQLDELKKKPLEDDHVASRERLIAEAEEMNIPGPEMYLHNLELLLHSAHNNALANFANPSSWNDIPGLDSSKDAASRFRSLVRNKTVKNAINNLNLPFLSLSLVILGAVLNKLEAADLGHALRRFLLAGTGNRATLYRQIAETMLQEMIKKPASFQGQLVVTWMSDVVDTVQGIASAAGENQVADAKPGDSIYKTAQVHQSVIVSLLMHPVKNSSYLDGTQVDVKKLVKAALKRIDVLQGAKTSETAGAAVKAMTGCCTGCCTLS